MKILWHSNAPFVGSGYGTQTEMFSRLATAAGHQVIVSGFYGLQGAALNLGGVTILPNGFAPWGNDVLVPHYETIRPDALVALVDIWVMADDVLERVPVTAWAPVDHDPMPPLVEAKLKKCAQVWAMSRFAEREMRRIGLAPRYVPHGVDTGVFYPRDRAEARRKWGVAEDAFFAVSVAANKGWPSRKSLDRLLKAWGRFTGAHPEARLYLHSLPGEQNGGIDLERAAAFYGVSGSVRFPDVYRMARGAYDAESLAWLYSAADVLVLPSSGGGFEIPLIEAQACGCPVVTTGATAMRELGEAGYVIEVDPFDGMALTLQYSEQANVLPSQILAGIEWAFEHRGDAALRERAREFAQTYEAGRVWREHMLPALEASAGDATLEAERQARTAARRAMRESAEERVPSAEGERPGDVPEGARFPQWEAI